MKKVYIDFEMNMDNSKSRKDILNADVIAIGAIKYDDSTGEIDEFKSLIKPITTPYIYSHIQELTNITQEDIEDAPMYEEVMRKFKKWLGSFYEIDGIYTFGNLDFTCFNNTDKKSSQKYNHPRFINNIKDLFIDIKEKYSDLGIKCINYVSLKNLLTYSNIEFKGDAHDPLYDAYNLFILDKTLETNVDVRNLLIIRDFIRPPFTNINESLEVDFENYQNYLYNKSSDYSEFELSISVLSTIRQYLKNIINLDVYNIEELKDLERKLDVVDKLKDLNIGYFNLLDNLYFDIKDLLNDLLLYKVTQQEYQNEIYNIINLFEEDLMYESINIKTNLENSY